MGPEDYYAHLERVFLLLCAPTRTENERVALVRALIGEGAWGWALGAAVDRGDVSTRRYAESALRCALRIPRGVELEASRDPCGLSLFRRLAHVSLHLKWRVLIASDAHARRALHDGERGLLAAAWIRGHD